jgi:diketogulonate reductase-like aldo/keto reductase
MNIESKATLNNGTKMPYLGLGTWDLRGESGKQAIAFALEIGYRHLDTAQSYRNEAQVGQAVIESGIPREEIFITTKVDNPMQGAEKSARALEESLEKLQTDYVDLYLIHWPDVRHFDRSLETWETLIKLQEQGKTKAIGVSNYTIKLIQQTIDSSSVIPAVNQVEFHPFLVQKDLLQYCRDQGVQLESYSPLARAKRSDNPLLQRLADKYGKTPEQVILAWHLAHDLVTIPRSGNPDHIQANAEIFDIPLTPEEVDQIDGLDTHYRIVNTANPPEGW